MVTKRYTFNGTTYIEYEDGRRVIAEDRYFNKLEEAPIERVPHSEYGFEMDTGKVYVFDEENKVWKGM